jgi:hypothetical protein
MSNSTRAMMMGAAGAAGDALYVDEVFSTYLYDGNGSTQTITNGIDLSGEGGLVWIKGRSVYNNILVDTVRGAGNRLSSDNQDPNNFASNSVSAFTSSGFTLGSNAAQNAGGQEYASWTFRKAPGLFDVVTWTGNGVAGRTVSHNLGSTPGCVIIKCTSHSDNWYVQHRSIPATQVLLLNDTTAAYTTDKFYNTYASSTHITLPADTSTNGSGRTFVAYLFAHDDQSFGTGGNESIIKCDLTTMPPSGTWHDVDLGWEPQWVLVKNSNAGFPTNWHIFDNMRGVVTGGNDKDLFPDSNSAESSADFIEFTPTGFRLMVGQFSTNQSVIYIAIRRPNKPPEAGTEVFSVGAGLNAGVNEKVFNSGFPVDLNFFKQKGSSANSWYLFDRFRGANSLSFDTAGAESTLNYVDQFDHMDGIYTTNAFDYTAWIGYQCKRAPGFFDVVAYTGTGSARTVNHNLGVVPEMMIVKRRNDVSDWLVYVSSLGNNANLSIHRTDAVQTPSSQWNATTPTASVFSTGGAVAANLSGSTYIAYLFATLPGISKVGSYTGTGNAINVDCGFSAGARFILIKRTDSTGDWYVYDTVRGIVSGNDPYLLLNSSAAEVTNTDYIDPLSSGFTVTSSAPTGLNASGGTYIFLAIA